MKTIAKINSNDQENEETIFILVDKKFNVSASNGDEVSYGESPRSASKAFELAYALWGQWNTFQWLAEYDEETNEITEM